MCVCVTLGDWGGRYRASCFVCFLPPHLTQSVAGAFHTCITWDFHTCSHLTQSITWGFHTCPHPCSEHYWRFLHLTHLTHSITRGFHTCPHPTQSITGVFTPAHTPLRAFSFRCHTTIDGSLARRLELVQMNWSPRQMKKMGNDLFCHPP